MSADGSGEHGRHGGWLADEDEDDDLGRAFGPDTASVPTRTTPQRVRSWSLLLAGVVVVAIVIVVVLGAITGRVQDGRVEFPAWTAPTERPSGGPPNPMPVNERIGFAVVGLGRLAFEEILPAFGEAKRSRLAALVSGTPDKAARVAAQYGIPRQAVYDYAGFDRIRDNPDIRAVYVVLPNSMHKEYTVRAAEAGKDVLCEKPMAISSAEGQAMVDACRAAGRKLMVAYRCQYEPYNREVLRLVRSHVGDKLTVIAVGGIADARDAAARLGAGADLVQVYSGLIYGGPLWPGRMLRTLRRKP